MNHHQKRKTHMKTQIFILSFIAIAATSLLGAPGAGAPDAGASAPSQAMPARPSAGVPPGLNTPSTQPGSPATGPQTMVTNNVSGQNTNQPPQ
jgi:hypothetical protein